MSTAAPSGWTLSPFNLVFPAFLSTQSKGSACTQRSSKADRGVDVLHKLTSQQLSEFYPPQKSGREIIVKKTSNLFHGFWETARVFGDWKTKKNEELGFEKNSNCDCDKRRIVVTWIETRVVILSVAVTSNYWSLPWRCEKNAVWGSNTGLNLPNNEPAHYNQWWGHCQKCLIITISCLSSSQTMQLMQYFHWCILQRFGRRMWASGCLFPMRVLTQGGCSRTKHNCWFFIDKPEDFWIFEVHCSRKSNLINYNQVLHKEKISFIQKKHK